MYGFKTDGFMSFPVLWAGDEVARFRQYRRLDNSQCCFRLPYSKKTKLRPETLF